MRQFSVYPPAMESLHHKCTAVPDSITWDSSLLYTCVLHLVECRPSEMNTTILESMQVLGVCTTIDEAENKTPPAYITLTCMEQCHTLSRILRMKSSRERVGMLSSPPTYTEEGITHSSSV